MIYKLTALITIGVQTEVEAESLEEAIELSKEIQDIGHFKDGFSEDFVWTNNGDFDGSPFNIQHED